MALTSEKCPTINKFSALGLLVTAQGIVFGDIGTSPLYVMKTIYRQQGFSADYIIGAVCASSGR